VGQDTERGRKQKKNTMKMNGKRGSEEVEVKEQGRGKQEEEARKKRLRCKIMGRRNRRWMKRRTRSVEGRGDKEKEKNMTRKISTRRKLVLCHLSSCNIQDTINS
jgi:hypothetical protein